MTKIDIKSQLRKVKNYLKLIPGPVGSAIPKHSAVPFSSTSLFFCSLFFGKIFFLGSSSLVTSESFFFYLFLFGVGLCIWRVPCSAAKTVDRGGFCGDAAAHWPKLISQNSKNQGRNGISSRTAVPSSSQVRPVNQACTWT